MKHLIALWRNGFIVDDSPLRSYEDPANSDFLESIKWNNCPSELIPELDNALYGGFEVHWLLWIEAMMTTQARFPPSLFLLISSLPRYRG
ncbi:Plant UBX domain-containing protein 4, partial [Linum perenne]